VPLGGVERRREILGEVGRDLETVVEARREPFGTLGQREQPVPGQVDTRRREVRHEHIEEDEDASCEQEEEQRLASSAFLNFG
jgi:hypothetical protein